MTSIANGARFIQNLKHRKEQSGLGRALIAAYRRLGMGQLTSYRMARWSKIALSPRDYLRRRALARQLGQRAKLRIPGSDDYLIMPAGRGPDLSGLVSYCDELFERKRDAVLASVEVPVEVIDFARDATGPVATSPEELAPIVAQVCHPDILATVADYIGEMPVLGNVSLWYTRVNQERSGPQNIHRDMNATRQLHLVVAVRDIDDGTGPFTFLPGDKSRKANETLQHTGGRIPDETFWSCVSRDDVIPFTGPAGAAMLVNPYACFHFGGRAEIKPRLVLIVSFTSKYESAEEGVGAYRLGNRADLCDGSAEQKLLLDLPD